MSTGTAVATEDAARFAPARLPWHPVIEERFGSIGANKASWKALTEAVFPSAKSIDSVVMALSYCAARKLDPFKRPVHIVPMWDSQSRQMVETVWPGISEIRTTAFRTGQYAGCDEVEFGPMIERTFTGMVGKRGYEKEVTLKVTFPEWGRINVYRILNGQRCKFVSPKVYWLESYGRQGATDVPNDMWAKRPSGQLEKCVEAAGLRKAFPEEVGNDYSAEEMHGQVLIGDSQASQAQIAPPPPPAEERPALQPPTPVNTNSGPAAPPAEVVEEAEIVEAPAGQNLPQEETELLTKAGAFKGEPEHPPMAQEDPFDVEAWLDEARERFQEAKTAADVDDVHAMFEDTATNELGSVDRQKFQDMHEAAVLRTAAQTQSTAAPPRRYFIHPESDSYFTTDDGSGDVRDPLVEEVDQDQYMTFKAKADGERKTSSGPGAPPPDDEDDGFPGNDAIAANEPQKSPGELYLDRVRAAINDPVRTLDSLSGLWTGTKAEREGFVADNQITRSQVKELHGELMARWNASQAKVEPDAGVAKETDITVYDRDFRARVEACKTAEEVGALVAGTIAERNGFSDAKLKKEWTGLIADRRKQLAGVA